MNESQGEHFSDMEDALHREARVVTRLDDFGGSSYLTALRTLLRGCAKT